MSERHGGNEFIGKTKYIRKNKCFIIPLICLFVCVLVFGIVKLIYSRQDEKVYSSQDNYKEKEQPVALKDFDIATVMTTLSDGTNATLKLVMTKGQYYDVEYAGYGGGTYEENYSGTYELQLFDSQEKCIDTLELNADWNAPTINFPGYFEILFADYNNDNCMDFTIGTYASSNLDLYYLYTINQENQIKLLYPGSIGAKDGFSTIFDHKIVGGKAQFSTKIYNNAIGQDVYRTYVWDEDSGLFELIE